MSNFFKTIHNKLFYKKEQHIPPQNTIQIPEKIVAEIDYEKLAEAIVKANEQICQNRKNQKDAEIKEEYEKFDKSIGLTRYEGEKLLLKIISFLLNLLIFPLGILLPNFRYTTKGVGTHKLFTLCNKAVFGVFGFYILIESVAAMCIAMKDITSITTFFTVDVCLTFAVAIILLYFYYLIDITRIEISNITDKAEIITIFSCMTALIGVLIAIYGNDIKDLSDMLQKITSYINNNSTAISVALFYTILKASARFFVKKEHILDILIDKAKNHLQKTSK